MPEPRLYETRCKACGRLLVTVERLRDDDISAVESHLRGCRLSEPLPPAPVMLGELMSRVRVAAINTGSEASS